MTPLAETEHPDRPSDPPVPRRVRIQTTPPTAVLSMDGTRVANPYDARLNQGGAHSIEARADGYQTRTESVSFAREVNLRLTLERIPAPAPPPVVAARPSRPSRPSRPAHPRPARPRPRPAGAGFVTDNPY